MNESAENSGIEKLHLLLFTVGAAHFGCHSSQILEISDYNNHDDDLRWFHDLADYGTAPSYLKPTVITVKTENAGYQRVVIDRMEAITEFSLSRMVPVPALLESRTNQNGIWGVLLRHNQLTLLVDICRMLKKG